MFSFFKRKKPSAVETDQQDSAAPGEDVLSDQQEPEPEPGPEPKPEREPEPVPESQWTADSPIEPSYSPQQPQEYAATPKLAVESEAPQGVVDLVPPPAQVATDAGQDDAALQADLPATLPDLPSERSLNTPIETEKSTWLTRLKKGLSRTGQNIGGLFVGVKVDESLFEDLETALIMADAGVEATEKLLTSLRARVRKEKIAEAGQVKAALRDILADHLAPLEKPFPLGSASPLVIMIAGVNGAGKTTSIGKLAYAFQAQGAKVLLAAGDTFRAAAREQLMEWGARNNVTVIAQDGGDPAAVAFDAVNAGRARQANVVMVDTAGRLPTQLHLMEELKKIKRVIGKADGAAPHEVLLVIDGNTGQNAIAQIRAFDAAITLTGLVVTKLDGTAKGGTLAAVAAGSQGVRPVPVYWIGVGEALNDLQPFVAREFAAALIGD
ncbi:signal recognition particle-docking protein FtsY [Pollutimonas nitritireducens]|uniref:Signal recognition particle receptor FtsY n=1 Tax=Pollutimonas nitritireducens TaxID=2045209 RepID=A0A2N4UBG6_9BURK|nr:signal recognition particle-docking protein FtsY [Pollutimonas nitritireducens]PLC52359.1 signal recognition particle-docking protein FtsY [Pollutimonas nitritireducens]